MTWMLTLRNRQRYRVTYMWTLMFEGHINPNVSLIKEWRSPKCYVNLMVTLIQKFHQPIGHANPRVLWSNSIVIFGTLWFMVLYGSVCYCMALKVTNRPPLNDAGKWNENLYTPQTKTQCLVMQFVFFFKYFQTTW